jgi:hypothetical protein
VYSLFLASRRAFCGVQALEFEVQNNTRCVQKGDGMSRVFVRSAKDYIGQLDSVFSVSGGRIRSVYEGSDISTTGVSHIAQNHRRGSNPTRYEPNVFPSEKHDHQ